MSKHGAEELQVTHSINAIQARKISILAGDNYELQINECSFCFWRFLYRVAWNTGVSIQSAQKEVGAGQGRASD